MSSCAKIFDWHSVCNAYMIWDSLRVTTLHYRKCSTCVPAVTALSVWVKSTRCRLNGWIIRFNGTTPQWNRVPLGQNLWQILSLISVLHILALAARWNVTVAARLRVLYCPSWMPAFIRLCSQFKAFFSCWKAVRFSLCAEWRGKRS